jgi:hypothetical protein
LSDEHLVFKKYKRIENSDIILLNAFNGQVEKAICQHKSTILETLAEVRQAGRKMIPSIVIGLLFHGEERSNIHFWKLVVTEKLL